MHTLALGAPALDATTSAVISARSSNVPVLDATTRSTCPCSTRKRARYAHSLGVLDVQRPCNTRRHDGFATNYVVVAHNGFAVRALDEHLRSTRPRHPYSARCRRSTRTRSRSARLRSSRPRHPRSLAHVRKSKPRRTTALRRTTASARSGGTASAASSMRSYMRHGQPFCVGGSSSPLARLLLPLRGITTNTTLGVPQVEKEREYESGLVAKAKCGVMAMCVQERKQPRDALTGLNDQRRKSKGTLGPELDLAVHPDEERIAQRSGTPLGGNAQRDYFLQLCRSL